MKGFWSPPLQSVWPKILRNIILIWASRCGISIQISAHWNEWISSTISDKGKFDVLIGINLLREGLDIPEVSLVAILDADKEGFLRSTRSLIQTCGRASRNVSGQVIMYADFVTTIHETGH